ncbi:uncharacterized protein LOC123502643 [Portunus trituberculatus]|uniref:uncharacterized protein LOC123502643 n=1 Tax=Portunus trituberculatus TaxID=210409 RepID=UPI001E1CF44B|nr:uncharacterized protein LOC123502643 [Portunus trituberculatus]
MYVSAMNYSASYIFSRDLSKLATLRESALFTALAVADAGEKEQLERIVMRIPNLPLNYMLDSKPVKYTKSIKCSKYPTLYDIQFNNIYWQVLHTTNGTFYLYSAFFDNRPASPEKPSVRILAMVDRVTPAVTTRCQLWYEGEKEPIVSKISEYKYIWVKSYGNYKNGILQPYLLQCIVPKDFNKRVPLSVSLVEDRCDPPKNNLRVINNLPGEGGKENFAVCVKGISGSQDNSLKMVEWLELMFLLSLTDCRGERTSIPELRATTLPTPPDRFVYVFRQPVPCTGCSSNKMTKTRGQHNQAAGQTAQQGTSTGPAASSVPPVVSSPTPSAPSVLTTTNVTNPVCTSPADLLSLVTADTATISEEGKTIVNTIVKAVQILINQKDQTIEKMQNHIVQLENKIAELENEIEEEKEMLERKVGDLKKELAGIEGSLRDAEEKSTKLQHQLSSKVEELKKQQNIIHKSSRKDQRLFSQTTLALAGS